jgi:hypothetical protein
MMVVQVWKEVVNMTAIATCRQRRAANFTECESFISIRTIPPPRR